MSTDTDRKIDHAFSVHSFPGFEIEFLSDGTVMQGGEKAGSIEQGPSGLWRFWRTTPFGDIPLRGYYPNYAIAEVGVRAYLESYGDPEYGRANDEQ